MTLIPERTATTNTRFPCRLDERVESAPSNTAKIKVLDTFPPDVPVNLVIFTAKDQIFLTWETCARYRSGVLSALPQIF